MKSEEFYENLWKEFVSLQHGDAKKIVEEVEYLRRENLRLVQEIDDLYPHRKDKENLQRESMMNDVRWIVSWTEPLTGDDWDLIHSNRNHFPNKQDAISFAETKKVKGKPFYWQPHIWKEEKIKTYSFDWCVVKDVETVIEPVEKGENGT